jgi:hypothetical protein
MANICVSVAYINYTNLLQQYFNQRLQKKNSIVTNTENKTHFRSIFRGNSSPEDGANGKFCVSFAYINETSLLQYFNPGLKISIVTNTEKTHFRSIFR